LDDLLDFGGGFEFGTDDPRKITVEYTIKSNDVMPNINSFGATAYYKLLREYVYSCSIRIARDMFALLPVKDVIVHAVDNKKVILSIDFDKTTINWIKFNFIDAVSILGKFKHNVSFDDKSGFKEVKQVE